MIIFGQSYDNLYIIYFFKFKFIYFNFNWRLITLQYCIVSATRRRTEDPLDESERGE